MPTRIMESSGAGNGSGIPVINVPFETVQTPLTASGTSQQSAAFTQSIVYIESDETIHVAFGANPTATTNHRKIVATRGDAFGVKVGHKVAIITGT